MFFRMSENIFDSYSAGLSLLTFDFLLFSGVNFKTSGLKARELAHFLAWLHPGSMTQNLALLLLQLQGTT